MRRNKSPYNMPDWNETPADTEKNADKFKYSAGGTNDAVKIPHQMSLFNKHQKQVHLRKWVIINRIIRKSLPSYTQQSQHQNKFKKFQNKYYCIPQPELKMHKRELVASASSSKPKRLFQFYNAKHLYNREKQRLPGETWIITPPHNMTHIWQRGPLQQICKLSSKFRR